MTDTPEELNSSVEEVKIEDIENEETKNGEIEVLGLNNVDDILTLENEGDESAVVKAPIKIISTDDATYYEEKETEDDDDIDMDETLSERLWGLTEMFPDRVRNTTWTLGTLSVNCATGLYQFSRAAFWIFATSAIILAAPPLIENEKAQLEELNRQQQRQILLGPSASLSGAPNLTPAIAPAQAAR